MPEPGEGAKPPVSEIEPGATGDNTGATAPSTPLSPVEERRRILERRRSLARPIVDRFMADGPEANQPKEYFFEKVARYYKKLVSEFNEDDIDTAEYNYQRRNGKKDDIVTEFAQTNIPEGDLDEFIPIAFTTGKLMALPGEDVNLSIVESFAYASESIERGKLYQQLAERWIKRFPIGKDKEEAKDKLRIFTSLVTDLSGVNRSPRPPERSAELTTALFDSVVDVYDYLYSKKLDPQVGLAKTVVYGAKQAGLDYNDAGVARRIFQIFKDVENLPDQELAESFLEAVNSYTRNHPLTDAVAKGFLTKVLPAMQSKDPQVELLLGGGNIWSVKRGDFGAADFICYNYTTRITSANINELLILLHAVPTTNSAKLNQNRSDAYGLNSSLRELVHDQRPYVHDLMAAMLQFYETGNKDQLVSELQKGRAYEKGGYPLQFDSLTERVFDKDYYEREMTEEVQGQQRPAKVIDVLRRLVENTKPIPDLPPQTSDQQLNRQLQLLAASKTGMAVSKEALQTTLDYLNGELAGMVQREEIGIEPNYILALAWVGRRAFEVLQNLKYEEQQGAYKQDWFSSILRFQELTASTNNYNEAEVQDFIRQVRGAASAEETYKLVQSRTLENNYSLAKKYKAEGKEDIGFLWSGNTAHEVIGLTDYRHPETEQGRKAVKEKEKRKLEPGYHPGD